MPARVPELWRHIWRHDWRELSRSGRAGVVGVLLVVLLATAFVAGATWVGFQQDAISRVLAAREAQDAAYKRDAIAHRAREASVQQGAPQHPVSVYWKRAYAWKPPAPASVLAVGQTDLHPYYAVFHGVSAQVLHYASELRNPAHLLIGIPDAAFVVTYLLPLLVLVLTYDLIAAERDSGRMALLLVQAGRLHGLVLARLVLRAGGLALAGGLLLAGGLAVVSPAALAGREWLQFLLLAVAYVAGWAGMAAFVNTLRLPAWLCGLILVSAWVVFVFLIPTALHALAERRHPIPSRTEQVIAATTLRQQVDADRPAHLARLLEARPELARAGDPARRPASGSEWYTQFLAYQMALEAASREDERRFTDALEAQERFTDNWRLVSPAIVVHRAAQRIAGTSTADMLAFREGVERFRAEWLEATRGYIFRNEYLDPEDFDRLPRYEPPPGEPASWAAALRDAGYLTALALGLIVASLQRLGV